MASERLLVEVSPGGSYAPCAYLFRIVNEREHRRAMAQVAANGGSVPEDPREDNVLFQSDEILEDIPPRHRRDLEEGWSVRFLMDRWTAFAFYGYDASEVA